MRKLEPSGLLTVSSWPATTPGGTSMAKVPPASVMAGAKPDGVVMDPWPLRKKRSNSFLARLTVWHGGQEHMYAHCYHCL